MCLIFVVHHQQQKFFNIEFFPNYSMYLIVVTKHTLQIEYGDLQSPKPF